jgi:hypothetical protein
MLEGARNLAAGRYYLVVESIPGSNDGSVRWRLSKAIDDAVDRTRMSDATHPGWRVLRIERNRVPEVVWPPSAGDDDGDGEDSLVPRRPRRPPGSGAIALPFP